MSEKRVDLTGPALDRALMQDHQFRRLLVVGGRGTGKLASTASGRGLLYASPSPATSLRIFP